MFVNPSTFRVSMGWVGIPSTLVLVHSVKIQFRSFYSLL
jgi:hypothetical protein